METRSAGEVSGNCEEDVVVYSVSHVTYNAAIKYILLLVGKCYYRVMYILSNCTHKRYV